MLEIYAVPFQPVHDYMEGFEGLRCEFHDEEQSYLLSDLNFESNTLQNIDASGLQCDVSTAT